MKVRKAVTAVAVITGMLLAVSSIVASELTPAPASADEQSAPRYTVNTFKAMPGYASPGQGQSTGTLNAGTNYVYCKVRGPEVREGDQFNSWWLRTDLDEGTSWQNQYVSAFGLSQWDNDEAKDVNGAEVPDCGADPGPGDQDDGGSAAKATYTVGQFNMAGGHDDWSLDPQGPGAFVESVKARKPAFVTIQEACKDWVDEIRNAGMPEYDITFRPVKMSGESDGYAHCKHPKNAEERGLERPRFGTAILFRKDLGFDQGPTEPHDLGTSVGSERRQMQCVTSRQIMTVVCTAHLTTEGNDAKQASRRHEASIARGILRDSYGEYTQFLGMDMNDDPLSGTADYLYHPAYGHGAQGALKELFNDCGDDIRERLVPAGEPCRSGERTTGGLQKIDYIFASPLVEHIDHDVNDAAHSDHRILWATVKF